MKRLAWLALPACLVVSAPHAHAATDHDFRSCDGYEAPRSNSDSLSTSTWLFGMGTQSADVRRDGVPRLGRSGLEACDRALADGRLKDTFLFRRANLVQSKAIHAIAAGNPELALALVDQSDRVGSATQGPYFGRSVGAANMAIRAYALIELGRKDDARRAIDALIAIRRWSQSIRQLAFALEVKMDHRAEVRAASLRSVIPLHPRMTRDLFWTEFLDGNYAKALEIYPALDFSQPNMRGNWSLEGGDVAEARALEERTTFVGATAYALATLGRGDDARALIGKGMQEVEQALVRPPPRSDGRPPKKSDVELFHRRTPFASRAKAHLEHWQRAVEFRLEMGGRPLPEFQNRYDADKLNELPILADILSLISVDDPGLRAELASATEAYRVRLEAERTEASALGVADLMILLPRPETDNGVPVLKPAGDGYFLSDSGLSRAREGDPEIWTIRYTHKIAPIAAAEELAMLGAAQTAQSLGRDSLLLLNTIAISRTTNVSGMYTGSSSHNSGYEAQLRVQFVDAASLTEETRPSAWRLISAQQVIAELESRYRSSKGITIAW